MYVHEVYDSPFDDAPHTIYTHKKMPRAFQKYYHYECYESCADLLDNHGWSDFRWFECTECGRMICEQSPSNGWHQQYREMDEEQVCLRCYEKLILENGISRKEFEEGHLNGMFFSNDNHEALDAGYEIDESIHNKLISGRPNAREVCSIAIAYIDSGEKVVIGYESMAIGGLEGYVTLFHKKEESK